MHRNWDCEMTIGRNYLARRSSLPDQEMLIYDKIYNGIKQQQTTIIIDKKVEFDKLNRIMDFIRADAPALFWMGSSHVIEYQNGITVIRPNYVYESNIISIIKMKIEHEMKGIYNSIGITSESVIEFEFKLHDYLTSIIEYSDDGPDSHNIIGPLLSKRGVCEGIAATFNFIMNSFGIDCLTIRGKDGNNENHAWNIVKLDDGNYHVDVTHDLSGMHTFLNVNDEMMKSDRTWNTKIECMPMTYNYYKMQKTEIKNDVALLLLLKKQLRSHTQIEFRLIPDKGLDHVSNTISKMFIRFGKDNIEIRTAAFGVYQISNLR